MRKSQEMASEYLKVQSKLILEGKLGENNDGGAGQQEAVMQPEVPREFRGDVQGP